MTRARGLGRGLSALLGEPRAHAGKPAEAELGRGGPKLPVAYLTPSPLQPRTHFPEEQLGELADSIRARGMLQPILVRPGRDKDSFEIVAGERRWRAAQKAGLHEVPVVVRELTDSEVIQVAIIENVQRADLSPIEEARSYQRLVDEFAHTQDDVAKLVGKSRSHIANMIRLLALPADVVRLLDEGRLTMGHARALIGTDDPSQLAQRILSEGLSVRDIETVAGAAKKTPGKGKPAKTKDANTLDLERQLSHALGVPVAVQHTGRRGGRVVIKYSTLEQLDDICKRLVKK